MMGNCNFFVNISKFSRSDDYSLDSLLEKLSRKNVETSLIVFAEKKRTLPFLYHNLYF